MAKKESHEQVSTACREEISVVEKLSINLLARKIFHSRDDRILTIFAKKVSSVFCSLHDVKTSLVETNSRDCESRPSNSITWISLAMLQHFKSSTISHLSVSSITLLAVFAQTSSIWLPSRIVNHRQKIFRKKADPRAERERERERERESLLIGIDFYSLHNRLAIREARIRLTSVKVYVRRLAFDL